jgi:hypothetical protein
VAVTGEEWQKRHELGETLSALERQMRAFMLLSFGSLDRIALKKRLDEIGTPEVVPPNGPRPSRHAITKDMTRPPSLAQRTL